MMTNNIKPRHEKKKSLVAKLSAIFEWFANQWHNGIKTNIKSKFKPFVTIVSMA